MFDHFVGLAFKGLRHLVNYDSADIPNHFKSGKTCKKDMDTQKKVNVQDFYEKDMISKVLPYKKLTKKLCCQMVNKSM